MDTHLFDGKLKNTIKSVLDNNIILLSRTEVIDSNLYNDYVNKYNLHVNFQIILQDYNTSNNYDRSNEYSCEIILTEIIKIYNLLNIEQKEDLLSLLNEQFEEMKSGMCPQGRTHRLFYILFTWKNII